MADHFKKILFLGEDFGEEFTNLDFSNIGLDFKDVGITEDDVKKGMEKEQKTKKNNTLDQAKKPIIKKKLGNRDHSTLGITFREPIKDGETESAFFQTREQSET